MPARRTSRHSPHKPKLFQCTGFGDCKMVFTRSEHLARHTRKHTGEKPFGCIVPGCARRFSRFDNMMQHTQTHRPCQERKGSVHHEVELIKPNDHTTSFEQKTGPSYESSGLLSPVSLGSPTLDDIPQRRLSVADLCNEQCQEEPSVHLTQDEFEALEGFALFRESPIFEQSLRDLASVAHIETTH
ncbi:hypothetical protein BCR43DRAFT_519923 [Syncephalastrum racemosum]|uniref:C2H2-type domain-containing protein n=1 Tax=Syncephalastrum racemosum TaxID=13706 RepID=A0A1X2HSQ4_SYNRA|nr:hypothetical protein BCR43DRAFT_519923 [Syncephalastrum racemosum]